MHVISMKRLREFWTQHPDAEVSLRRWHRLATRRRWENLAQVREDFPHADPVRVASGRRVYVFNVGGNKYRLIAALHFNRQAAYALRILTHVEYDRGVWKVEL